MKRSRESTGHLTVNTNRLVMVVSNAFRPDPRVYKEAKSLVDHDFKVTVYAWDRECKYPSNELIDRIFVERVRVKSRYGNFLEFMITTPIFWLFVSLKILTRYVTVVHCHDFDTVPVGVLVRMLRHNVKIVYDAHEVYPAMIADNVPYILYALLCWIDRIFMRTVDCVIIPLEERRRFYTYARRIIVVPNTPKFVEIRKKSRKREFSVFYGGGLIRENGILLMVKTILGLRNGVKLFLAGDGPLRHIIEKLSENNSNARLKYLGFLSRQEVLKNLADADITFVFYEPVNVNNIYASSNKLFEAMMVGVPIIINKETVLSTIVDNYACGVIVPYGNVQKLRHEIIKLKNDPSLRKTLGENGKRAFKENFAWNLVESEFISSYKLLLKNEKTKCACI